MIRDHLQRLRAALWDIPEGVEGSKRQLLITGRYATVLIRDLMDGELTMRAMSLVYTTLLSIVPLLALAFSVLKALGAHNSLEPVLLEFLRPLGGQGSELAQMIIGFVDNMKVGVLGFFGVGMLFLTALSLIQKVEASFNYIWGIERLRPFAQRVGEYLSLLIFGPLMAFAVFGITAAALKSDWMIKLGGSGPLGAILATVSGYLPYVMIIGFFAFLYIYIPNTRVRMKPALGGALVSGVLWQTSSFMFARYVASATQYDAVYKSFAIIIFLLIWLYVGWLIILTGCKLTYYLQYPYQLLPKRSQIMLMGRSAEVLALTVMGLTGQRQLDGETPLGNEELERSVGAAPSDTAVVVQALLDAGLLIEAGEDAGRLMPARDLSSLTLGEILRCIRSAAHRLPPKHPLAREADARIAAAELGFLSHDGQLSLRDWLLSMDKVVVQPWPEGGDPVFE